MKRLLLVVAMLLSIGGSANAWLCAPSTWVPYQHPWPASGWCEWQPNPYDTVHPNVTTCASGGPTWGFAYLYSGINFTGDCAAAYVGSQVNGIYTANFDYFMVELDGWYSTSSDANGITTPIERIQSIKLGGSAPSWGGQWTKIEFSSGPTIPDPPGATFTHCNALNNFNAVFEYPNVLACLGGLSINSLIITAQ